MVRDYHIHGETMVYVKGGAHLSLLEGSPMTSRTELGLASDQIKVIPQYHKKDVKTDNFGPDTAVDLISYMSECTIEMNLVHFDAGILNLCMIESNGGYHFENNQLFNRVDAFMYGGAAGKAGALMGKGLDYFASGNNFISLTLGSLQPVQLGGTVLRFPTAYIQDRIEYPLGTKYTAVRLIWKAVPYIPIYPMGNTIQDRPSLSGIIFDGFLDT